MTKKDLEQDINATIKILYGKDLTKEEAQLYYKLYPWSNEKLKYYYRYKDLTDKKALTVTASGDHIISAIAASAKEVDCIDINKLAKYFASLKIATLLTYPKRKFIKSFNCSPKYLEPVIKNDFKLHHVSPFLPEEHQIFWQEISSTCAFKLYNWNLFTTDGTPQPLNIDYKNLKEKLAQATITYYDKSFKEYESISSKKYDAIFLSNVKEWHYENTSILDTAKLLDKDGIIYDYYKTREPNFQFIETEEVTTQKIIRCSPIWSLKDPIFNEGVVVYKKVR